MNKALMTTAYVDQDQARMGELLHCYDRNINNPLIDQIILLVEDDRLHQRHQKVIRMRIGRRPTYRDFFDHANSLTRGIVMIANSDVYFDETLSELDAMDLTGKFLAMTRANVDETGKIIADQFHSALDGRGKPIPSHSQDAWAFTSPIVGMRADMALGLPGCDNRIAFEAKSAGLEVSNPSLSINVLHLHNKGIRRYDESNRLIGPYLFVEPIKLNRGGKHDSLPS